MLSDLFLVPHSQITLRLLPEDLTSEKKKKVKLPVSKRREDKPHREENICKVTSKKELLSKISRKLLKLNNKMSTDLQRKGKS